MLTASKGFLIKSLHDRIFVSHHCRRMNENTALGKLIEVPLLVSIKIQTESFAQVLPRFKTVIKNQMNLEKVNTSQLF